ncbi:efflux transporter periplasmic adaptor subunit, partial [bacterium]|nr:efflux transporter periplasmic adaptor subunit [bacterium]
MHDHHDTSPADRTRTRPGWRRTLAICLAIAAAGAATIAVVFATEPTAKRSGAVRQTPMLVDVVEVARGTHRPTLVA